jgi:epsilon-lactone hydrolase
MKFSIESLQYEIIIKTLSLIGKRQMAAHAIRHPARKNQLPQIKRIFKNFQLIVMVINKHRVLTFSPDAEGSHMHLIYFHGGAYVWQGDIIHWIFLRNLMRHLSCRASYVDYPLAPEHGHIETIAMVQKAYENLVMNYSKDQFVFIGDSAGGGLALALAQKLNRERFPTQPEKMILISPWLDIRLENPQIEPLASKDPLLSVESLSLAADLYARGANKSGYLLSPINGDVKGLGEMHVFIGTRDILWPDCHRFFEMKEKARKKNFMYEYENMPHVWIFFPFRQAKEAISRIIEILKK